MNKEELLSQIKTTYYYSIKVQKANNGVENIRNESRNLGNHIVSVQKRIDDLTKFGNQVDQLSYKPNIIEPNIDKIKKWPFIIGDFLLIAIETTIPGFWGAWGLPVITIILTAALYMHIDQSRYQNEYDRLNGASITQTDILNENIEEKAQTIKTKISQLKSYIPQLQHIKYMIDKELMTKAQADLKQVQDDAPAHLVKIPSRRLGNPSYLLLLYEVIDTDQASSLGEAVRIVEDRFERAELNENLRRQIFESQKSLEKTLRWTTDNVISEINHELKKSTEKLDSKLHGIETNINSLNKSVIESGKAIEAELDKNNLELQGIRNSINSLERNQYVYVSVNTHDSTW